jgi:outer membrane protein
MKKIVIAALVAAAFAPALAQAEAGDFVVRLRATYINPDESSKLGSTVNNLGLGNLMSPGASLGVDSNTIPELDFSYYITKNIAAELILATGTRHDVKIQGDSATVFGNQNLGSVNLLPPTLTVQWHFMPDQTFDPYAGVGLSYVRALDHNLTASQGTVVGLVGGPVPIHIDRNAWGPAVQAGFDVNLKDKWLVNFDVKKIWFGTDVKANLGPLAPGWTKIDSLDVDPWVISVGFGKKL